MHIHDISLWQEENIFDADLSWYKYIHVLKNKDEKKHNPRMQSWN